MSVEQLVPRLGDYLLAQGYITEAQLQAALARKLEAPGPPLIGQVLVEMGAITRETLDRVIARQILELQNALLQANRTLERSVVERTLELESALLKLTEINQLKANIVANISHELRTPLTQVKGYTALMADGAFGPLTTEQIEALSTSLSGVERLERLIDDLITYASAARGEMTLNLQPVPIAPMLEGVVRRTRAAAEKKGVHLDTHIASGVTAVQADEEKIFWVLQQLTDNAIKFTPTSGRVTVSATAEGRRVRLAVQDTGIGIAPGRLDEIFEDFRQLDASSTRQFGGTGLGLSLVRRIVEAHGSRIIAESLEGRGSVFAFALTASSG